MTLSFRAWSFKLGVLPFMLTASVALGACQDSSLSNEQEAQEGANAVNSDVSNSDPVAKSEASVAQATADEVSAEESIINNLSRYRWTLLSATDNNAQPLSTLMDVKDQVRLSFAQYQGQNTLNYSVGCNTMSAVYQLQDLTLTIEDSMSTKMSCGNLDAAENSLSKLMQGESQLVLSRNVASEEDQPVLTQITSAATLVWGGKLTPQAKYNSKGETVFWAVNDKMIPCSDNNSKMCLQVKPVTYDDQGIKTSEGEWTSFNGVIDGYEHDGKHDEVLRLQRYQLDTNETKEASSDSNVSEDAYAYVLDAVIESSVVEEADTK